MLCHIENFSVFLSVVLYLDSETIRSMACRWLSSQTVCYITSASVCLHAPTEPLLFDTNFFGAPGLPGVCSQSGRLLGGLQVVLLCILLTLVRTRVRISTLEIGFVVQPVAGFFHFLSCCLSQCGCPLARWSLTSSRAQEPCLCPHRATCLEAPCSSASSFASCAPGYMHADPSPC